MLSSRRPLIYFPWFEWLKPPGTIEKVVLSTQKGLCSKLVVEEGIAMNAALMENL